MLYLAAHAALTFAPEAYQNWESHGQLPADHPSAKLPALSDDLINVINADPASTWKV